MNFRNKETVGENIDIAGRQVPKKGFAICRECGKVQGAAENDYPPIDRDEVYKEIFEQAENFKKYQMVGTSMGR